MTTRSLLRRLPFRAASLLTLLALLIPAVQAQISLPIDFENGALNYELQDFEGTASSFVADPTDAGNRVVQTVRASDAACFAGTTVADVTGFTDRIPFTADTQTMSVRVWSPEAGVLVLFKVEEVGNPGLNVETYSFTTVAGGWETIVFDFGNPRPNANPVQVGGNYNKATIFFDFQCDNVPPSTLPAATRTYYWDDVEFGGEGGGGGGGGGDIALPIDFEDDMLDYELQDFGGAEQSMVVADPTDASNMVVQTVRPATAECFAGTTVADVTGFASRIPFTADTQTMSVRVWSPEAGALVLFKVEEVGNPGLNVETFSYTTVAGGWETMVFDFGQPMPNTNPIQIGGNYNKATIFFDFQCDNVPPSTLPAATRTYYWDDVAFGGEPMTGQTIAEARALGAGNEVTISGVVTRARGAFTYFQDETGGITVRQTSGAFFDDVASGAIAPGTQVTVTGTTSEFNGLFQINGADFGSYMITGTTAVPAAQMITLSQLSEAFEAELVVITDLTTDAEGVFAASTNYDVTDADATGVLRVVGANDSDIDDTDIPMDGFTFQGVVGQFNGGDGDTGYQLLAIDLGDIEADPVSNAVVSLPITFEEEIDYELQDFGGAASMLVTDPTDATNTVVQTFRSAGAECFAGTTVADIFGFTDRIPFTADTQTMNVRVWSPEAGIRVLFKVEEVGNPGLNVETFTFTTVAGGWETMVFDFGQPMPNTNPVQIGGNYNKASIFFDFQCGLEGAPPADRTYYWDDVAFGLPPVPVVTLPVTFEDDIDYGLVDFGGAASQLIADPEDAENTVVETVRTAGADEFAGTTVAKALGFVAPMPFTETMTQMSIRVWTPVKGTAVRVRLGNADDPEVSVETQVQSVVAMGWHGLTLNFANQFPGTPELDLAADYNTVTIFFDADRGVTEERTYYWDDIAFGPALVDAEGEAGASAVRLEQNAPNPLRARSEIRFTLPNAGDVQLHVYNALGQRVATLVEGPMAAGDHAVTLDASSLASGTYVYRLVHGSESLTRSMVVVR